ncbi:methionyl-tRNA formyltransferase [Coxiella-like endosymbiont]|uniref:methionyl-tRNA formyltransferase n=1 Tax=Coxiella-like endosymbiont TaxID=1592897 RepID=UPI00272C2F5C|nr:methionyl-tRNA formyltransferase [Coxiella-like endosymbiont]
MSLNVIFAGTPQFAVPTLRALIKSKNQVIAVYTQPDRPAGRGRKMTESSVKTLALSQEITVRQPPSLRGEEEQKIIALKADIIVVVAYGLLLPRSVLGAHKLGGINVHASLLPRWRGAAPIQHAILAGDQETGVTIMQMDEGLDTGDILTQKSCPIGEEDTAGDLYERLFSLGADLLIETLDKIESRIIYAKKQDSSRATYALKIQKKDAELNWHQPAVNLARQVRAFNPTPITFTYFKHQPIRIWQAEVLAGKTQLRAGSLIRLDKNRLDVATGDGVLRLHQLQLPGKRIQSARDFINAYRKELIPGETIWG